MGVQVGVQVGVQMGVQVGSADGTHSSSSIFSRCIRYASATLISGIPTNAVCCCLLCLLSQEPPVKPSELCVSRVTFTDRVPCAQGSGNLLKQTALANVNCNTLCILQKRGTPLGTSGRAEVQAEFWFRRRPPS